MSFIVASRELAKLRVWTRGECDPDLTTFSKLDEESRFLPAGPERAHWAAHALARCDGEILEFEARWQERALSAARNLVDRYAWSLVARKAIRHGMNPSDAARLAPGVAAFGNADA